MSAISVASSLSLMVSLSNHEPRTTNEQRLSRSVNFHSKMTAMKGILLKSAMVNAPLTIRTVTWESNLRLFTTAVRAFT